jgi:hypothetical protein
MGLLLDLCNGAYPAAVSSACGAAAVPARTLIDNRRGSHFTFVTSLIQVAVSMFRGRKNHEKNNHWPIFKKLYTMRKKAKAIIAIATNATPLLMEPGMELRFIIMMTPSENAAMMKMSVDVVSKVGPPVIQVKKNIRH